MKPLVKIGAVFLVALVLIALMVPAHGPKRAAKILLCKIEMSDLNAAVIQYHNEYGNYPFGNQIGLIRCLLGDNLRKIEFLHLSTNRFSSDGGYLDPWLTPYQIEVHDQTNLVVHSAGPNRIFGDADDLVFNSASNGFVKP
jgi:hypothetical protein